MYLDSDSPEMAEKKAVTAALALYLDFINLLMMLLQLLGQRTGKLTPNTEDEQWSRDAAAAPPRQFHTTTQTIKRAAVVMRSNGLGTVVSPTPNLPTGRSRQPLS
jgi:hypothetical protein